MDELLRYLDSLLKDSSLSREWINKAESAIKQADVAIADADRVIKGLSGVPGVEAASVEALETIKSEAPKVFTDEVQDAIMKNEEFAYYAFLDPLFQIANNPDLFDIHMAGTGATKSVIVKLDMDGVAGNISDYANAVDEARNVLGIRSSDPVKASETWRKVYKSRGGASAYGITISERLALSQTPAPFWSLLNYGNKISMASDIGGHPYPNRGGTRFVEKTEQALETMFRDLFSYLKTEFKQQAASVAFERDSLKKARDAIYELLNNIDAEKLKDFARKLGVKVSQISPTKLLKVLDQVRSGTSSQRPYIGKSGVPIRRSARVIERAATLSGIL